MAISGNYDLKRIAQFVNDQPVSDIRLPQTAGSNTRTGTLVVTRINETTVDVNVIQLVNGTAGTPTAFGKMTVQSAGDGYELYQKNIKNGTASSSAITFEVSDTYQDVSGPIINRYLLEAKR